MTAPDRPPRGIVTFKIAQDNRRTIWTAESPEEIESLVNYADKDKPLIQLTSWTVLGESSLYTRFDNIATVEEYR